MKRLLGAVLLIAGIIVSCTDNARARGYGGTMKYELGPNEEVIGAGWKGSDLWILIKDTVTNKVKFKEDAPLGIIQGTVEFKSPEVAPVVDGVVRPLKRN